MLNNIRSLLARDSYDIKSGKYINHYLQKFVSSISRLHMPMFYLKGALFLGII